MESFLDYEAPSEDMILFMETYKKSMEERHEKFILFFDRLSIKGYSMDESSAIIKRYIKIHIK
jgi:hypothetical protein